MNVGIVRSSVEIMKGTCVFHSREATASEGNSCWCEWYDEGVLERAERDGYRTETMRGRKEAWGEATAFLARFRRTGWVDLVLLVGITGVVLGLASLAGEWRTLRPAV